MKLDEFSYYLSELHKLLDLLVVERAVLSIVLADKVLKDTKDDKSVIVHHFNIFVVDYQKSCDKRRQKKCCSSSYLEKNNFHAGDPLLERTKHCFVHKFITVFSLVSSL